MIQPTLDVYIQLEYFIISNTVAAQFSLCMAMFTITLLYLVSIQHIFSVCVLLIDIAYTTFFLLGLLMSMQVPFVGFQPLRTSEHMAAAGIVLVY